jgi:hypothetical protein
MAGQGEAPHALPLAPAKPWPRDLRGRLRVNGTTFQALLPGMRCNGATEPALSMECRAGDEPWVLESGSRALLLADFAAGRNYFDGRVTTQTGQHKTVAPFFSAASVESQGRTWWLLASLDGKTQILDAALDPAGALTAQWGSDIAGTDAHCGAGSQVLATRSGDGVPADSVQAFTMVDRSPEPLSQAVEFPGPVVGRFSDRGSERFPNREVFGLCGHGGLWWLRDQSGAGKAARGGRPASGEAAAWPVGGFSWRCFWQPRPAPPRGRTTGARCASKRTSPHLPPRCSACREALS